MITATVTANKFYKTNHVIKRCPVGRKNRRVERRNASIARSVAVIEIPVELNEGRDIKRGER
jgi:hypothetical protein